jgi:hypothetical protein
MSNVIAYPAAPRRSGGRRGGKVDPLISEIVEALVHFRGQAHRDLVCDYVASMRAGHSIKASAGLRTEMIAAFRGHLAATATARQPRALLELPFGEGSHRWGLSAQAVRQFEGRLFLTRWA